VMETFCPECNMPLKIENSKCPECGSPLFGFEVPMQGQIEYCSKKSCPYQAWSYVDAGGQKEFIEIKIRDTGCGIEKENLEKIFEPFFSTKGQKGTGLGLAVIWGIIDNHNGTITVESEVNKGTTFIIHLPLDSGK